MTTTEIVVLQFLCALALASVSSYLGGRVHQRRREDQRRRTAFREGFLRATAAVVALGVGGEQTAPPSHGRLPGRPAARKAKRARFRVTR
jgi:hypothetical protein